MLDVVTAPCRECGNERVTTPGTARHFAELCVACWDKAMVKKHKPTTERIDLVPCSVCLPPSDPRSAADYYRDCKEADHVAVPLHLQGRRKRP